MSSGYEAVREAFAEKTIAVDMEEPQPCLSMK